MRGCVAVTGTVFALLVAAPGTPEPEVCRACAERAAG